jgi:hypothetical protein
VYGRSKHRADPHEAMTMFDQDADSSIISACQDESLSSRSPLPQAFRDSRQFSKGAATAVIVVGAALEAAKLVSVAWLGPPANAESRPGGDGCPADGN